MKDRIPSGDPRGNGSSDRAADRHRAGEGHADAAGRSDPRERLADPNRGELARPTQLSEHEVSDLMRESAPTTLRNEQNELDDRTVRVMQDSRERARRDPESVPLDRFRAEDRALQGGDTTQWANIAAERWGTVVGLAEVGHAGAARVAKDFGVGPRAEARKAISDYYAGGDRDRLNAALSQMMPAEGDARRRLIEEPPYSETAYGKADIDRTLDNALQALMNPDADPEEVGATALEVVARALPGQGEPNRFPDVHVKGLRVFEYAQSTTLLRMAYRIRGVE